jgi:hypothetical protein
MAGDNRTTKEMGLWRDIGYIEGCLKSRDRPIFLQKAFSSEE